MGGRVLVLVVVGLAVVVVGGLLCGGAGVADAKAPAVALSAPVHDAVAGAQGVARRLLGEDIALSINFEEIPPNVADGHDVFELESNNGQLTIRGNTAVSMSSGLYWYLRYYCNSQVTWGVNGTGTQLNVTTPLPEVPKRVRQVNRVRFRYYQNVCTVSYSMAWWNWTRWEKELDWMALHGINLPLSFTGQEYVWYKFYSALGLTDAEIQDFFTGPAFLAWQRMGNLKKWAGPLDPDWRQQQYELQKKILARARSLGMISALPGFSGHVPAALKRVLPGVNLTTASRWSRFNTTYTCGALLQPTDPHFEQLGTQFYKMLIDTYGTDHVFQMDTFNEMHPRTDNMTILRESNTAVYRAMANADPEAVYLMQGWLFHEGYWTQEHIKVYLSGVPSERMIILDLNTEAWPVWNATDDFYGKMWVWNMLLNFGGRRGLYGNLTSIATRPLLDLTRAEGTMDGTGITPEAIENNPVMFEMMLEVAWHDAPLNVRTWVEAYAASRYGRKEPLTQAAWQLLRQEVYSQRNIDRLHLDRSPDLKEAPPRNSNATALTAVWRLLEQAAKTQAVEVTGPFSYDLVDVGRQVLLNLWSDVRELLRYHIREYNSNAGSGAGSSSDEGTDAALAAASSHAAANRNVFRVLLDLISDLDWLLASDVNYLLGVWLETAKAWGTTAEEIRNREFNARNQITLWGPEGEINDYAAKHWSGLVGDYYGGRWAIMHDAVLSALKAAQPVPTTAPANKTLAFSQQWGRQNKTYPSSPSGDVVKVTSSLLNKYAHPSSNYTVTEGHDVPQVDIAKAWTTDVDQLKVLCDADPTCVGFNSNGYLKHSLEPSVPSPERSFTSRSPEPPAEKEETNDTS